MFLAVAINELKSLPTDVNDLASLLVGFAFCLVASFQLTASYQGVK